LNGFLPRCWAKTITPQESEALGNRFAEYVLDELRRCELILGIQETLDSWRGKLPMFVCSGAPQEEVLAVLRERGLAGYFDGIHGSPPAKAVLLGQIVARQKLDPADVLMVGDAPHRPRCRRNRGHTVLRRGAGAQGRRVCLGRRPHGS